LWFTHYSQLGLLKGASAGTTTLTSTDLANIRDVVWQKEIDSGYEAQQLMRLFAAVLGGLVGGMKGGEPAFRNLGNTKDVIKMTTDKKGNRIAVITLDLS